MPNKWKARREALTNALVLAEVATIDQLAEKCGMGRGAAGRVMRGQEVTRATMIAVCSGLSGTPGQYLASDLFEVAA